MLYLEEGKIIVDNAEMYRVIEPAEHKVTALDNGRSSIALRGVYFEKNGHKVILDPGPGTWIESFFPAYQFELLQNAAEIIEDKGYNPENITDVFLTHLHFDHCAGIFAHENNRLVPAFPGATIHVSSAQYNLLEDPSAVEADDFLPGFNKLVSKYYRLSLCDGRNIPSFLDDIVFSDGHSAGMMSPVFSLNEDLYIFPSDLIPTRKNMVPEVVSGYDCDPSLLFREKLSFFDTWGNSGGQIIFFHEPEPENALFRLTKNENRQ